MQFGRLAIIYAQTQGNSFFLCARPQQIGYDAGSNERYARGRQVHQRRGGDEVATKKAQRKAGIAAQRRGQQMGDERSNSPNKMDEARENTPALRGRRKTANKFFADDTQQAVGGNAARPRSNSPSVPAAVPTNVKKGEPGGEAAQKTLTQGPKTSGKGRGPKG